MFHWRKSMAGNGDRKLLIPMVMLVATFGVGVGPKAVLAAGSMHTQTASDQGVLLAQNYDSKVWVKSTFSGGNGYGTGTLLDPYNLLFTGHQAYNLGLGGFATDFLIGTGDNYLTDPGDLYTASDVVIHPGWDGTLFSQKKDYAILHLATPIWGVPTLQFGSAAICETLYQVGYGKTAIGGSYTGEIGQARFSEMVVDAFGLPPTVSTDYIRSILQPISFRNMPMAGGLTSGDSGSPVFNSFGELVGLGVGQSNAPGIPMTSWIGRVDLENSWIHANLVPEPGTLSFLLIGVPFALIRRKTY